MSLAVTMYRWVDDEGNVSYQDTPPPRGENYEATSISKEGARTGKVNPEIALARAARENPVVMYSANNCESCVQMKEILTSIDIPFETIEVDTSRTAQNALIELVGSIRVPTLTIGDKVLNGTNRANIEDALIRNGYPKTRSAAQ
jgi:glutaredoxin